MFVTNLDVVGQECCAGETAADVAAEVDDEHAPRADQLLKVPHEDHLNEHRDDKVKDSEIRKKA